MLALEPLAGLDPLVELERIVGLDPLVGLEPPALELRVELGPLALAPLVGLEPLALDLRALGLLGCRAGAPAGTGLVAVGLLEVGLLAIEPLAVGLLAPLDEALRPGSLALGPLRVPWLVPAEADPRLLVAAAGGFGEAGGAKVRRAALVVGASSAAGAAAARASPGARAVAYCRRTIGPTAALDRAGASGWADPTAALADIDRAKAGGSGLPARTDGRSCDVRWIPEGNWLCPIADARLWPSAEGIDAPAAPLIIG